VQTTVDQGYIIPFISKPPPFFAKNNQSSLRNPEFVETAISELLANNCIEEVSEPSFCCNPLTVAEGKKLRLVLDLRHVNEFVKQTKFRYEDLRTFSEMYNEGDYFFTFDLTSGYHHIEINPEHCKYLGFYWTFKDGTTRYFQFCVLPFGLTSACFAFTKVLRPFVRKWRLQGLKAMIYLDDGFYSKLYERGY